MSFYTSLTGLQAATTELSVTSNNIANAGTSGFKRADADFGDIFASTPLQKSGSIAGSGVSLNGIVQQHTQGNIEFSTNSLDLAITGDGYFKLKTTDGAELYTRNGGFMLDDQNRLVNSAGQALQILEVDSINNANFEAQTTGLTVQRSTVGEFKSTSEINLGLNLPSSAEPITEVFSADKPETYHKTTSFTTYGANGQAQLATIYYVKTANPTDASPFSKWQTYVTIDGKEVRSALTQSAGAGNDPQFINKYGEIKTQKELDAYAKLTVDPVTGDPINQAEYLITAGTTYRKYSFDKLQTAVPSENASVTTELAATAPYNNGLNLTNSSAGVDFTATAGADGWSDRKLYNMFKIQVDGSTWQNISLPRLMDNSHLATRAGAAAGSQVLSGKQIAQELTNELNKAFGDDPDFTFAGAAFGNLNLKRWVAGSTTGTAAIVEKTLDLEALIEVAHDTDVKWYTGGTATARTFEGWQLAQMVTKALAADAAWNDMTMEYDAKNQGFVFHSTKATPDEISIGAVTADLSKLFNNIAINAVGANAKDGTTLTDLTLNGSKQLIAGVRGNGAAIALADRRSGLEVTYAGGKFMFKSGTTGDASSIHVRAMSDDDEATPVHTQAGLAAQKLLGLSADNAKTLTENNKNQVTEANLSLVENIPTVRGQKSQPARMTGNAMGVDTEQAFNVTAANQSVTAVIDGITGNLKLSLGQYNIDTFVAELQTQINRMSDANGKTVNNVVVGFDSAKQALTITGATTSSKSFIQMLGSQDWGLTDVPVAFGTTSTYAKIDTDTLVGSNLYVSQDPATGRWNESVDKADFDAGDIPYWTPIFLDRGEITFDTSGALTSPQAKYELESNAVTGNVIQLAYTGSTQYNSAFAAVSQSQNGKPEGDLNGISIGDDGLIVASYSNGTQKSLGKIVIANFNSSSGLNQIGDSSWIASAESGAARLGEAGSAGFGTIRAGSRERSNVDLTNELVDLIAAQRNFQANAKAIETNTAMTNAIIQIRG